MKNNTHKLMKHILLPTDFSDNSWNAIIYAIKLFKNEDCTFHLLNTYTPAIYRLDYVIGYPEQFGLVDAVRNTSRRNLYDMVSRISSEFPKNGKHNFRTHAKFDTMVSGVRESVDNLNIDLIVMGTKGATGAKEVLFGSNTVHVFKNIKCPILAIPSGFEYEKPLEILFPTDLNVDYNRFQIDILKHIVITNTSRVNALHVSEGRDLSSKQKNNQFALEAQFKEGSYLFHHFKSMNVTTAIDTFQLKSKINLLAMINNKHSFFENLFFKSTVNQIGFNLPVPFLVIPSKH